MNGRQSSVAAFCRLTFFIITLAALSACGGSSSKKYTIGGTVSGLTGTVVLQNNGGDNLTRNSNGSFTFAGKVKKNKTYAVTVATQPVGQTCVVTNGSGTATANVTNVVVTCTTNTTFTVGGNVSGLTGTVVLRQQRWRSISASTRTAHSLSRPRCRAARLMPSRCLRSRPARPAWSPAARARANANVTNVVVTCTNNPPPPVTYTIGGNVTGLTGARCSCLQNNGGENLHAVNANGPFTFDRPGGSRYGIFRHGAHAARRPELHGH